MNDGVLVEARGRIVEMSEGSGFLRTDFLPVSTYVFLGMFFEENRSDFVKTRTPPTDPSPTDPTLNGRQKQNEWATRTCTSTFHFHPIDDDNR